ncbi:RNA polymerase sigma factor [Corynebacterium vitaeruminis]|uniref:RNA polymerase sigma factor n=1 Tax=Corynebacterium vitaeruminis TaxID=38305 RepID=UPI00066046D8|nr:sigma-70 family RNA polymerase sigma factor [Corynebacterium vitaeruminis]
METKVLERELVQRAQNGDQAAFAELIRLYKDSVFSVCLRMCSNYHDAEDAFSIAVASAYKYLDRFRGSSSFKTWFTKIALNACKKQGQKIQKRTEMVQLDSEAGANMRSTGSDIDTRVAVVDQVQTALDQLKPNFREVLILRELAGYTYEEIAAKQRIPLATVKSRLNRARKQMLELLKEE